jgi:hypothetical protein
MTCDEFRENFETIDPRTTTNAMRAAMVVHNRQCPPCRKWVGVRYNERQKTIAEKHGKAAAETFDVVSKVLGAVMAAEVKSDSECREMIDNTPVVEAPDDL